MGSAHQAVSLTGAQAGIVTDGVHTKAKIANITPRQIRAVSSNDGNIVIVAGFQGQTIDGQHHHARPRRLRPHGHRHRRGAQGGPLPDLHRRGRRLHLRPAHRANARKIDEISYDEMLEMASSGSKVMQSRSVEFAKKFGVIFEVRSSFNNNPGTIVKEETTSMENVVVRGVSIEKNQAKVTIIDVPDQPGTAARIFTALAGANVSHRHDRAERLRKRHDRHFLHAQQGRPARRRQGRSSRS